MVYVKTSYPGISLDWDGQVLVMVSVKEFLFISFFIMHCSVRCIDFFVSREYMVLSTFVVTKLGRNWESVYLM